MAAVKGSPVSRHPPHRKPKSQHGFCIPLTSGGKWSTGGRERWRYPDKSSSRRETTGVWKSPKAWPFAINTQLVWCGLTVVRSLRSASSASPPVSYRLLRCGTEISGWLSAWVTSAKHDVHRHVRVNGSSARINGRDLYWSSPVRGYGLANNVSICRPAPWLTPTGVSPSEVDRPLASLDPRHSNSAIHTSTTWYFVTTFLLDDLNGEGWKLHPATLTCNWTHASMVGISHVIRPPVRLCNILHAVINSWLAFKNVSNFPVFGINRPTTCINSADYDVLTSPKAPLPMHFRCSKSCTPSFERFRRKNSVSFKAWRFLLSFFCSSVKPSSSMDISNFLYLWT